MAWGIVPGCGEEVETERLQADAVSCDAPTGHGSRQLNQHERLWRSSLMKITD